MGLPYFVPWQHMCVPFLVASARRPSMFPRTIMAAILSPSLVLLGAGVARADLALPQPSPLVRTMQTVGLTEVEVTYSSPAAKGRTVWGELVPYNQHWRTGANANTLLRFSGPVRIGGQSVPAGEYSLHSIPGKVSWTIIVNRKTDGSGSRSYDQKQDVLRATVSVQSAPKRERMTFIFSDTTSSRTYLDLEWAGVRIRLPISVDTGPQVQANIDREVQNLWRAPAQAARYLVESGGDLVRAGELVKTSIAIKETWYNRMILGMALGAQGQKKQAIVATQRALSLGDDSGAFRFYEGRMKEQLESWRL